MIRGWICANMAHSRRQNGVLGVSVIVAHAGYNLPGQPSVAQLPRGRSPELPAEHGAFALGGTASVASDLFSAGFGDPIRSDPICGFH